MPCVLCALDIILAGDCVDGSRIQDVAGLTLQLMTDGLFSVRERVSFRASFVIMHPILC